MSDSPHPLFIPDNLLQELRTKFAYIEECPYMGKRTFFDSSSGSLRLKSVLDVAIKEILMPDQLSGIYAGAEHCRDVKEKGEQDLKLFLGAKSGIILPSKTSTEGLFRLINAAVAHFLGSNVVTTAIDHPATFDGIRFAAKQCNKECRIAPLNPQTGFVDLENILLCIDENTSVFSFNYGSNITGALQNAKQIIQEVRKVKKDICIIVDGVQCAPHSVVDVEELGADAFLFGGYKTYTRRGISFAHISDKFAQIPHEKLLGASQSTWTLGSQDHFDYASWSCVVDYLCWLGGQFTPSQDKRTLIKNAMGKIAEHENALLHRVINGSEKQKGLKDMEHIVIYAIPENLENRICLVPFKIQNEETEFTLANYKQQGIALAEKQADAYSEHILSGLKTNSVIRFSGAHYNTPKEVDEFLRITEAMKK